MARMGERPKPLEKATCKDDKASYKNRMGERIDWMQLAEDTDKWRAFVNSENESSASIKCREILDWLRTCWFLKKGLFIHGVG